MSGSRCRMRFIAMMPMLFLVLSCGDDPAGPGEENYPTPSVLTAQFTGGWLPPDTSKGTCSLVELSWTMCPDSTFWKYKLYRSVNPDIQSFPDSTELLGIFEVASDIQFSDSTASWDTAYYYALSTTGQDTLVSWSNEVSVYIPPRNTFGGPDSLVATIDVGAGPGGICALPSGNFVYVACYFDNMVYVLDTSDQSVTAVVPVESGPVDVCYSSGFVFVSGASGNEVHVIRTSDNTLESTVNVGESPSGLCITPDEERVYICCSGSNEVWCLDAESFSVIDIIPAGNGPGDICCLPSGDYLYLTNRIDGTVMVIRASDNVVISTLDIGVEPCGICSSITGDYVYICDFFENRVLVLRTSSGMVEASINVGYGPLGINALPNGNLAYVSCYLKDRIYLLDLSSNSVAGYLPAEIRPNGVCSLPSSEYVYAANSSSGSVSVFGYSSIFN